MAVSWKRSSSARSIESILEFRQNKTFAFSTLKRELHRLWSRLLTSAEFADFASEPANLSRGISSCHSFVSRCRPLFYQFWIRNERIIGGQQ